ncbi:uncharacterized protein LOC111877884 [Lactuca sativa]|uniref:uncharacterized protein LOC111877884 n=1 Tax=Lactuca sativa TaxID=4236 RepID=UPI000CB4B96D|nr:uncharacterized protein LOC111877884 [Lactuca sativa]
MTGVRRMKRKRCRRKRVKETSYSIVEELAGFGASIHMCSRNQKEINERLVGMDGNRIKELLESEFICSTSSFFFKFLFSFEFGKICFEYALHLNDFSALEFHKVYK